MKIRNGKIELKEVDIQRQVCKYLKAKGYFFSRTNNIAVFDAKRGLYRKNTYMEKGMPDILVFIKQRGIIGLEIKRQGAYQSKEQKHFQKMFEMAKGEYYVIRSLNEAEKIL